MAELGKDLVAIFVAMFLLISSWHGLFAASDHLAEKIVDLRSAATAGLAQLPR